MVTVSSDSSPEELEVNGAVITDAVPLDIIPADDQDMVENGVMSDEEEEEVEPEEEDIIPADDQEMVENGVLSGEEEVDEEEEAEPEEEEDHVVDDDVGEDKGIAAAEEGRGNDVLTDSFEDESDDEEARVAAEEGGDTVYFSDEDDNQDVEEEDYVLNDEEEDDEDYEDEEVEVEEEEDEVEKLSSWLEGDDAGEDEEGGIVGKESDEKEGVEKVDGDSETKARNLKKKIRKVIVKKFELKSSNEAAVVDKGKTEKDGEKGPVEEEKGKGKEEIGEKGKEVKKRRRLRKRDKQIGVSRSTEKVASKPTDKSGSKSKEEVRPNRVESMGMIFICSTNTKQDCYRYKVLGLPAGKQDLVEKIYKGMRLFLYDVDLKLMYGIYKAAARGGYNLEPKAFNSKFPSQVRFSVHEDCIPLAEEKFRKVLKENYFSKKKFDCQLNQEQVKNLCQLFTSSSKGPNSRRLDLRPVPKPARALAPKRRDRPGPSRPIDESRKRDRPRALAANEGRQRKRTRRVDGERGRRVDGERARASGTNERRPQNGYRNYPHLHQREVVAPPLPVLPQPYAYERTLERDAYRPAVLVEHHRVPYREPPIMVDHARDPYQPLAVDYRVDYRDPYRQPALPDYRDAYRQPALPDYQEAYRQQPLPDYQEAYRQDPIADRYAAYRRDRVPEQAVSGEPRHYEPYNYLSYNRDREVYQNPIYVENRLPVEPDRLRSFSRTDYRSGGPPVPDYRPSRGLHHRY